jgi:hypothetical protein
MIFEHKLTWLSKQILYIYNQFLQKPYIFLIMAYVRKPFLAKVRDDNEVGKTNKNNDITSDLSVNLMLKSDVIAVAAVNDSDNSGNGIVIVDNQQQVDSVNEIAYISVTMLIYMVQQSFNCIWALIISFMDKTKQVTTVIKPKSMVEHEHDFVKETNRVHCSTCRAYYCHLCGKRLEHEVTNHLCYYLR